MRKCAGTGEKTLQSLPGLCWQQFLWEVDFFPQGKMDGFGQRVLCILCTDSQQMLGNNLWSFNCMDCIAASWETSQNSQVFSPCGILICIYCTVCYPRWMFIERNCCRWFLQLLHGQIKEQIVPRLGGLVVFGLFLCSFPSNLGSQGWEGPWNVFWAAELGVFFALFVFYGEKEQDKRDKRSSEGFSCCSEKLFWFLRRIQLPWGRSGYS